MKKQDKQFLTRLKGLTGILLMSIIISLLITDSKAQTLNYNGAGFDGFNSDIVVTNYNKSSGYATGIRFQSRVSSTYRAYSLYNDFNDLHFTYSTSSDVKNQGSKLMTLKSNGQLILNNNGTMGGKADLNTAFFSIGTSSSNRMLFDSNEIYSTSSLSLGSDYDEDIFFRNVNSQGFEDLMVIKQNGNIGVGNINPDSKLHISSVDEVVMKLEADTDNANESHNPRIEMSQDGGIVQAFIGFDESNHGSNQFAIGSMHNDQNHRDAFVLNTLNGNIGMGTTNPTSQLHISEDLNNRVGVKIVNSNVGEHARADLRLGNGLANGSEDLLIMKNSVGRNTYGGSFGASIWNIKGNLRLIAGSGGKGIYVADPTGNVGIGTESPSAKLDVAGNIKASQVTLDVGSFPDYVFSQGYEMLSVKEVENYIKANGRLPKMPSEKEVKEAGMDVGQINVLLVEKVEELTLYLIEQQKQIEELNQRLNKLNFAEKTVKGN